MSDRNIYFNGIGSIKFVKSKKARRVTIRVISADEIKVSVPSRESLKLAKLFVEEKSNWIKKHVNRLKENESKRIIFDEHTNFQTKHHTLKIIQNSTNAFSVRIINNLILIKYPVNLAINSESTQSVIRNAIEEALRIEANDYIPEKARELAEKYNFNFNRIFIKNVRSRWGSCSKKNNLNFSIHLMILPYELIDYVILHELAHTVEHNHSKKYWAVLNKIYGDSKSIDKQLKNYKIGFYESNKIPES